MCRSGFVNHFFVVMLNVNLKGGRGQVHLVKFTNYGYVNKQQNLIKSYVPV